MFFHKIFFVPAALTGILIWLSFPGGGNLWPLLFVALVPLFIVIRKGSARDAGLSGFIFGIVHFLLLLYWIVIVLKQYGDLPWAISVLALLLLAFYLSIYFLIFGVLARYIFMAFPAGIVLWLLPTLWVGIDWLRGILFTGFPWMDLGYGLWEKTDLIQIADLLGHHGVTWMIVFTNSLLAILLVQKQTVAAVFFLISSFVLVFGSGVIYSQQRVAGITHILSGQNIKKMRVGIVQ